MATLPAWPPSPGAPFTGHRSADPSGSSAVDWIFEDPRSKALIAEVEQVAPSDASVLIRGETGTGKELIARHLHACSGRRDGPFVVVSCGAFSASLVDAELFGHENGAFAGAFGTQPGWFEAADGGTIFLDEIDELPLAMQNKLLRVLEDREVLRLGGRKPIPVDLRIVAATTVDLEQLVEDRRFRKDLYYRLNVVNLDVLTLRERPADIVPLARYFIALYCRRLGYPRVRLGPEAEQLLVAAPWRGNVRELENVIHRSLLLCDGDCIDAGQLRLSRRTPSAAAGTPGGTAPGATAAGPGTPGAGPGPGADAGEATPAAEAAPGDLEGLQRAIRRLCDAHLPDLHQQVEDTLFREVYRYCHYSQSEAARLLGVSRNIVRARLIRLGEVGPPRRALEGEADPG